jgi:hypothetical protein
MLGLCHYIHARTGLCYLNPEYLRSLKMPPIKDEDRYLLKPVLGAKRDRALLYTPDDKDELVQPSKRQRFTTDSDHHKQAVAVAVAVAVSESASPPSNLQEEPIQPTINQDDSLCYSVDDDDSDADSLVGLGIFDFADSKPSASDVESLLDPKSLSDVDMGLTETEDFEFAEETEIEEIDVAEEEEPEEEFEVVVEVPRTVVLDVESNLGMYNEINEVAQEVLYVPPPPVSSLPQQLRRSPLLANRLQVAEIEEIDVAEEEEPEEEVEVTEVPRNIISDVESNLRMNNDINEEAPEVPFVPPPPVSPPPPQQLRRSPRLANRLQVPSALPALRRSPRLALKPRVSYVGMC